MGKIGLVLMEADGMEAVKSSLISSFSSIASNALSVIGSALPIALPIIGAVVVVTIGIKVFKKVSGNT